MTVVDLSTEIIHLYVCGRDREDIMEELERRLALYAEADYEVKCMEVHFDSSDDDLPFSADVYVEVSGLAA